ncbi:MAG: ribonuclease P protein component [Hyphomonadaceae bacterium]
MSHSVTIKRLTKRPQFLFVRQGARTARGAVLIEARRRSEDGPSGLGITASKKVGNAVVRNRARRRLREAARTLLPQLGLAGVDYVFVARQTTPDAPWEGLLDDVGNALIRLRADLENARGRSSRGMRGAPTESD